MHYHPHVGFGFLRDRTPVIAKCPSLDPFWTMWLAGSGTTVTPSSRFATTSKGSVVWFVGYNAGTLLFSQGSLKRIWIQRTHGSESANREWLARHVHWGDSLENGR
jgi:hypothetical protein